jgi:hypothetical protein
MVAAVVDVDVTRKGDFFLHFNLNFNKCAIHLLCYFQVYFTVNCVAWLVKREFSLNMARTLLLFVFVATSEQF